MRVFTRIREMLETHKEILKKLEELERKDIEQDEKIILIFEYLRQLEETRLHESEQSDRRRIGYKRQNEQ